MIELAFVFFSKIYIFFYKEKRDYWKIFPIIIKSTIAMINLQLIMSFIFSPSKYFILGLATSLLILFNILLKKEIISGLVNIQFHENKKQLLYVF